MHFIYFYKVLSNFETLWVYFRSFVLSKQLPTHLLQESCLLKKKPGKTNMGSVLGGAMKETMDDNMKKNQEFMLETQKIQVRQC